MTQPGDQPNPWSREGQWMGQGQPAPHQPEHGTPPIYPPPAPDTPSTPSTPPTYPPPAPDGPPIPGTPPIYPSAPYPPPPPPRRRTGLWVALGVAAVILVGLAMWGVIADNRSNSAGSTSTPAPGRTPASTGETTVVTASDQKCQLTVPVSWKDVPTSFKNELASLQVGDLRREQYALVISEDMTDFEDFTAFANGSLDAARELIEGAEIGDQHTLAIGGLNAVQFQVTGKASGIKVVFWYTMIEGKRGYYQVLGWTLPSKKAEAEPVILKVVESFRELGAG